MIRIDRALCAGCGLCVAECSTGAISLSEGAALIAPALCDDCGACVEICPSGALENVLESPSLPVVQTPVEVIPAETRMTNWRQVMLPAAGAALIVIVGEAWVGREVAPRLALLAQNALDSALSRRPRTGRAGANATGKSRGRQERRRRRGRRA
jgi:Fe-S-cluster-containing hydrogenase component 2